MWVSQISVCFSKRSSSTYPIIAEGTSISYVTGKQGQDLRDLDFCLSVRVHREDAYWVELREYVYMTWTFKCPTFLNIGDVISVMQYVSTSNM